MPWFFYDISYTPEKINEQFYEATTRSTPTFKSMHTHDAGILALHDDLRWSPNLQRYLRRLRLGDRDTSGTQFLRVDPESLVDILHLAPRLEALILRDIMTLGIISRYYVPEKSLDCLWLTSDGGKAWRTWRVSDLQAALGFIYIFKSVKELRITAPLNDLRAPPPRPSLQLRILPSRLTPVEFIVVKGARLDGEDALQPNWPHAYRELSRIIGSVVPLQGTRSVSIVNIINEGVLGLVHGDLERLRWSFCLEGGLYRAPGTILPRRCVQLSSPGS